MKIKKHLWKIIAFVLIAELENLWHSNVAVLAHGYLNEQVLCETGKTHPITHDVPSSLRQELEWDQRWVRVREVKGIYYNIKSKWKKKKTNKPDFVIPMQLCLKMSGPTIFIKMPCFKNE